MIISKEEYDRLLKDKLDWQEQAQKGLAVAKEIAATRDEYIEVCKKLKEYRTPMKTVEKKLPHVGEEEREHYCPNCNKFLGFHFQYRHKFCGECGQALKYEEEE